MKVRNHPPPDDPIHSGAIWHPGFFTHLPANEHLLLEGLPEVARESEAPPCVPAEVVQPYQPPPEPSSSGFIGVVVREFLLGVIQLAQDEPDLVGKVGEALGLHRRFEDEPETLLVPAFARRFGLGMPTVRRYIRQGMEAWGESHSTLVPLASARYWLRYERGKEEADDEIERLADARAEKERGTK